MRNWYDGQLGCDGSVVPGWPVPNTYNAGQHDSNFDTVVLRGNRTYSTAINGSSCWAYDNVGNPYKTAGPRNPGSALSFRNYLTPDSTSTSSGSITLTNSFAYTTWMGLTSATDSGGASINIQYDNYGRPVTSTAPAGAATGYVYYPDPRNTNPGQLAVYFPASPTWVGGYSYNNGFPAAQMGMTNQRWTRRTLDGLGRVIRVETGDTTNYGMPYSVVDTVYGPCACSPDGKMVKMSQPYQPSATAASAVYWTTYTYDGLGRTLSVVLPDGNSTTTMSYLGNTTKVMDPAGKWKTTVTDVQGNVTTVTEPDPASAGTLLTTYTYDAMEHLLSVAMPRAKIGGGSDTQNRTFIYDAAGKLVSETHPETGTTTYSYFGGAFGSGEDLLKVKTDAKGQDTVYKYDAFGRVLEVHRYPHGQSQAEDICQQVKFVYDSNPFITDPYTAAVNANGRLVATYLGDSSCPVKSLAGGTEALGMTQSFAEDYTYTSYGAVQTKGLHLDRKIMNPGQAVQSQSFVWTGSWVYNNEGGVTITRYPDVLTTYGDNSSLVSDAVAFGYDKLNRLSTADHAGAAATYNAANQITSLGGESRTYNVLNQLTGISGYSYNYSPTQNNGQIISMGDGTLGATVSYTYDSLKRLSSATAVQPGGSTMWQQTYSYDGWGNLYQKNLTGGSATWWWGSVDAATNRISSGFCYDANGNTIHDAASSCSGPISSFYNYDVANRLDTTSAERGGMAYAYNAGNKRIAATDGNGNETVYFYSPNGMKLMTLQVGLSGSVGVSKNYYFGSKLVAKDNHSVYLDRLGSVRSGWNPTAPTPLNLSYSYLPYGEETGTATTNGMEKFGTYTRDQATGLDYADQRYYASGVGRFMSADGFRQAASANDSGSWNKFSYTRGDPINRIDPTGQDDLEGLFDDGLFGGSICQNVGLENSFYGGCLVPPLVLLWQPPPSPPPAVPCTSNSANIFQTYADIGSNILEIAESGIKDLTGQEISGLQTLILGTAGQEGSSTNYYNGGHFNLDLSASELRGVLGNIHFRAFSKLFGGRVDGTRQAAVYGNPAQGNYTLHSKEAGRGPSAAFDFHFDIYNPLSGPVGLVGHLFGDVIGGHNGTPCLDPAWNQQ